MLHVQGESAKTPPIFEARKDELVRRNCREPHQRDMERVMMKDRDADQRQPEQNEIDGDAQQIQGFNHDGINP